MTEEVTMQARSREASAAAKPTRARGVARGGPGGLGLKTGRWGRISLLPRVILEVSLPRRMSSMISNRWERLCTKFRVADALQVKRRLWWGCTRCLPPDDRHVHESIALLRQASGQQGSDVAEAEVARSL